MSRDFQFSSPSFSSPFSTFSSTSNSRDDALRKKESSYFAPPRLDLSPSFSSILNSPFSSFSSSGSKPSLRNSLSTTNNNSNSSTFDDPLRSRHAELSLTLPSISSPLKEKFFSSGSSYNQSSDIKQSFHSQEYMNYISNKEEEEERKKKQQIAEQGKNTMVKTSIDVNPNLIYSKPKLYSRGTEIPPLMDNMFGKRIHGENKEADFMKEAIKQGFKSPNVDVVYDRTSHEVILVRQTLNERVVQTQTPDFEIDASTQTDPVEPESYIPNVEADDMYLQRRIIKIKDKGTITVAEETLTSDEDSDEIVVEVISKKDDGNRDFDEEWVSKRFEYVPNLPMRVASESLDKPKKKNRKKNKDLQNNSQQQENGNKNKKINKNESKNFRKNSSDPKKNKDKSVISNNFENKFVETVQTKEEFLPRSEQYNGIEIIYEENNMEDSKTEDIAKNDSSQTTVIPLHSKALPTDMSEPTETLTKQISGKVSSGTQVSTFVSTHSQKNVVSDDEIDNKNTEEESDYSTDREQSQPVLANTKEAQKNEEKLPDPDIQPKLKTSFEKLKEKTLKIVEAKSHSSSNNERMDTIVENSQPTETSKESNARTSESQILQQLNRLTLDSLSEILSDVSDDEKKISQIITVDVISFDDSTPRKESREDCTIPHSSLLQEGTSGSVKYNAKTNEHTMDEKDKENSESQVTRPEISTQKTIIQEEKLNQANTYFPENENNEIVENKLETDNNMPFQKIESQLEENTIQQHVEFQEYGVKDQLYENSLPKVRSNIVNQNEGFESSDSNIVNESQQHVDEPPKVSSSPNGLIPLNYNSGIPSEMEQESLLPNTENSDEPSINPEYHPAIEIPLVPKKLDQRVEDISLTQLPIHKTANHDEERESPKSKEERDLKKSEIIPDSTLSNQEVEKTTNKESTRDLNQVEGKFQAQPTKAEKSKITSQEGENDFDELNTGSKDDLESKAVLSSSSGENSDSSDTSYGEDNDFLENISHKALAFSERPKDILQIIPDNSLDTSDFLETPITEDESEDETTFEKMLNTRLEMPIYESPKLTKEEFTKSESPISARLKSLKQETKKKHKLGFKQNKDSMKAFESPKKWTHLLKEDDDEQAVSSRKSHRPDQQHQLSPPPEFSNLKITYPKNTTSKAEVSAIEEDLKLSQEPQIIATNSISNPVELDNAHVATTEMKNEETKNEEGQGEEEQIPEQEYPSRGDINFSKGQYSGELDRNGRPNGKGFYKGSDLTYDGSWDHGKKSGYGRIEYPDGSVYTGELLEDKRHGQGYYFTPNYTHVGEWENDKKYGQGVIEYSKLGDKYDGNFVNNFPDGKGTFTFRDGSVYCGEFEKGCRHGEGTLTYGDGITKYVGEWTKDKQTGKAILTYLEGVYEGEVVDGKREGHGTFTYANGDIYDGEWFNDQKQGKGIYFFDGLSSGVKYRGEWFKGKKHGVGILETRDNIEKKLTSPNSKTLSMSFDEVWSEGKLVSSKKANM